MIFSLLGHVIFVSNIFQEETNISLVYPRSGGSADVPFRLKSSGWLPSAGTGRARAVPAVSRCALPALPAAAWVWDQEPVGAQEGEQGWPEPGHSGKLPRFASHFCHS